nr:hypothetical protein [Tanacetum cinerariifolium]
MAEHGDEPKAESFMDKISEKIHRDDSSPSSSSDNESDKKKQSLHKDAPVTCFFWKDEDHRQMSYVTCKFEDIHFL